jgi:chromosome segregation protein
LLSDSAAQSGLQAALAVKLERESLLAAKRSEYDDLTNRLRTSNEDRLKIERELDPLRQRIVDLQLKEQAARLGFEQYDRFLQEAQADIAVIEASIEADKVKLTGLQSDIDRLNREIVAAVRNPEVSKRLADLGAEAVGSTPAEQDAILKRQMDQFRAVIREMKLE